MIGQSKRISTSTGDARRERERGRVGKEGRNEVKVRI